MKTSKKEKIIARVEELKAQRCLPERKPKIRALKKLLLQAMKGDEESVGGYFLKRVYNFGDETRPYLQIFTEESWRRYKHLSPEPAENNCSGQKQSPGLRSERFKKQS